MVVVLVSSKRRDVFEEVLLNYQRDGSIMEVVWYELRVTSPVGRLHFEFNPKWAIVYGKELMSVNLVDDEVFKMLSEKHGNSKSKAVRKARPNVERGESSDESLPSALSGDEDSDQDPYHSDDSVEGVRALRSVADANYPQGKIDEVERINTIKEVGNGCDYRRYIAYMPTAMEFHTLPQHRERTNRYSNRLWDSIAAGIYLVYYLSVNTSTGVACIHWKRKERRRMWPEFRRAYAELHEMRKAKLLTQSRSALLTQYGVKESVRRLLEWQNFHKAWLYRIRPPNGASNSYPLPRDMCQAPEDDTASSNDSTDYAESDAPQIDHAEYDSDSSLGELVRADYIDTDED